MPPPLEGVKVLDLTRLIVGGFYGMLLADAGAEVVKIEVPGRGDTLRAWTPSWWKVYGRGKKSLTLDLAKPAGQEILKKLAAEADVLAENFFPGKLESWGLSPEALHEINPRLVIVRISGWGQDGPYRDRPGFGTLVEATSGFSAVNGFPDSPPLLPPVPIADMTAGLYGVASTMFALYRRDALGGEKGQVIDLALYEPLFAIIGPHAAEFALNGKKYTRTGNFSENSSPRNCYATKDGKWIAISASTQSMYERLARGLGREDLISDPRFENNIARVANNPALDKIIADEILARTCDENMRIFGPGGVTAIPVYDIEDILADPHFQARDLIRRIPDPDFGEVPMHTAAPRMSRTPLDIRWTGPALGAHSEEILASWLGMGAGEVDELRRGGIV
ncbi:MAG: CoA transferase [bacterium]